MSAAPTILFTSSDASEQSGAFRCLLEMATEVRDLGYRSVMVLPQEHIRSSSLGTAGSVPTYVLPLPRPRRGRSMPQYAGDVAQTMRSAYKLARIIRRERVALVHVNEILDLYGGIAARIAGVPCVWHVRADMSSWPGPLRALLPRAVAALASHVVAVSGSVRELVFERHGVRTPKVSVIHDAGPDPSVFHRGVDGSAIRSELGLASDAPLVVLVSKLVEPKGHEVLIRAVPQLVQSFPHLHVAIVGGGLAGDHHRRYADRLMALPAQLGVGRSVTFMGYRNDVAPIMAAADVVIHCPTHADPFPGVVLQAMALGKAVIASNIGGAGEQIDDDISGVLIPPGDPDALAHAISSLVKDPERRGSLGRTAADRVASEFTSESFYRQLSDLYERLIGR